MHLVVMILCCAFRWGIFLDEGIAHDGISAFHCTTNGNPYHTT